MRIEMSNFSVTLQRKRVKNLNLRIQHTGEVRLSAPLKMPLTQVYSFLHDKSWWIEKHIYQLTQENEKKTQTVIDNEYVYFQGEKLALCIHETEANQRVELINNQLHCFVYPHSTLNHRQLLLSAWYRAQMGFCLTSLLEKWQSIMGITVTKINIKTMKSRWGSCHPVKKHITLNLRLMEKPKDCLEYVLVHELVHLFEPSHNHRFYALMTHYLPHWKLIKKQLT